MDSSHKHIEKNKFELKYFNTLHFKLIFVLLFFSLVYFFSYSFLISPKIEKYIYQNEETSYKKELEEMSNQIASYATILKEYKYKLAEEEQEKLSQVEIFVDKMILNNFDYCKNQTLSCFEEVFENVENLRKENNNNISIAFLDKKGKFLIHKDEKLIDKNINLVIEEFPNIQKINSGKFFTALIENKPYLIYAEYINIFNSYFIIYKNLEELFIKIDKKREHFIKKVRTQLKKTRIGENGYIAIIDKTNDKFIHPLAEFEGESITVLKNLNNNNILEKIKNSSHDKKSFKYKWYTNKSEQVFEKIAWASYNDYFDWYIICSTPISNIKSFYKELNKTIILISIAVFIALFVITLLIAKQITRPFDMLIKNIETFEKGDYKESSYEKIYEKGEIGLISESFNKMKEQIKNNISHLEKQIEIRTKQIKKKLQFDELTGLKNSYSLIDTLRKEEFSTVILIKVNTFSDFNEFYGYKIGSEILKEFAKKLEILAKEHSFDLFRVDGVTFSFVKNGPINFTLFCEELDSIFKKLNDTHITIASLNENFFLNLTFGISICQEKPLRTAYSALHRAKREGQSFCVYNNIVIKEEEVVKENLKWSKKIKYAILNENVVPYFQAIVDKEGNTIKHETLIRLKEEESIYSPFHFLDISKKTKQYSTLSFLIISKALNIIKEKKTALSINMSYSDISDSKIIELLDTNLKNKDIASKLTIEILEDDEIKDYKKLKSFISKYKKLGVKFAIDDFGAGYSNLLNIISLDVDFIKIDGSLIKNIDTNETSFKLVKSMVAFAQDMHIKVIVEYVHNKAVFEKLKELNIYGYQGYYFDKPKENF